MTWKGSIRYHQTDLTSLLVVPLLRGRSYRALLLLRKRMHSLTTSLSPLTNQPLEKKRQIAKACIVKPVLTLFLLIFLSLKNDPVVCCV